MTKYHVSIHALLAESDYVQSTRGNRVRYVSIHALLAESDRINEFRGGVPGVSIHALLAESDCASYEGRCGANCFNPRPPCGERPQRRSACGGRWIVSIHALLAESDMSYCFLTYVAKGFNPRPPCGERPRSIYRSHTHQTFQSTPSLRRATYRKHTYYEIIIVSIHALLAESDNDGAGHVFRFFRFNPRPPCGERLDMGIPIHDMGEFQSTPSLRRATASTVHVVNQSCK